MAAPKFALGQLVDFDVRNTSARRPAGPHVVTKVLPLEDGRSCAYRLKSAAEPFERVAEEHEIVAVGQDGG